MAPLGICTEPAGCTDWMPVSKCGDPSGNLIGGGIPNYLFQVVGFVNGNGGFDCNSDGICLQLTLAPANRDIPGLCGTATTLQVEAGDQVNFCYRVTNNSGRELTYQSLSDNVNGVLFTEISHPLAPGETWQFNRTTTIGDSATITVEDRGLAPMPVRLAITRQGVQGVERREISVDVWLRLQARQRRRD